MTLWKPIPLLPSKFEASDEGQIQILPYTTIHTSKHGKKYPRKVAGRILKSRINSSTPSSGIHPVVYIYKGSSREDNQHYPQRVARLVAAAFYGVPYSVRDQSQVQQWRIRFRDNDPTNCSAINLEWVCSFGNDGNGPAMLDRYISNRDSHLASDPTAVLSRLFGDAA